MGVDEESGCIGVVFEEGQLVGVLDYEIEFIFVDYEIVFVVGGFVQGVICKFDVFEIDVEIVVQEFVMVVWKVDEVSFFLDFVQEFLYYVVVGLWLVLVCFQFLVVDDVVDEIDGVCVIGFEKVE